MIALWLWLKAYVIAHQVGIAGIAAYAALEWVLPRIKFVKANSAIEMLANLAKKALLDRVPLVGAFVRLLATQVPAKSEEPTLKVPLASSARALLPLAFLAFALSACVTTPAGKAFSTCELGNLPAAGQIGFATAQQIASNQNSTAQDLESAALQMLPGQLECGAKALLAWLQSLASPRAPAGSDVRTALLAADDDVTRSHAIAVLSDYLKAHPATSCGARPRM